MALMLCSFSAPPEAGNQKAFPAAQNGSLLICRRCDSCQSHGLGQGSLAECHLEWETMPQFVIFSTEKLKKKFMF